MSSVEAHCGGKVYELAANENETLLSALRRAGFSIPAACGGRGKCGKCRVSVNGVSRLACKVYPAEGDTVLLPESAGGRILTETPAISAAASAQSGYAAAVDLGTTTVAVRVYELNSAKAVAEQSAWNAQSGYGADVISRIQHTIDAPDGLSELSSLIRAQVQKLVEACLDEASISPSELKGIALAGNTVMQHLFAGLSVQSIAAAPFKPQTLFDGDVRDLLCGAPVFYSPCVAGYVGGDITAGLLASGLYERPERSLFLDIGTNGEMALGGADGFCCCAVASGPAFEGAGISCGMPALSGAVSRVGFDRGFLWETVGAVQPRGICGSGLLDLIAVLLRLGAIDESGRLLPPEEAPESVRRHIKSDGRGNGVFYLTDEVYLTAQDVRNLQLAKAAVAAGIRVLLDKRGMDETMLDNVYIAGGFGNYIDPESAMAIGMLPRLPKEKLKCVGNTSLAGAALAALREENRAALLDIARKCDYIELSGNRDFTRAFTDNMAFV